MLGPTPFVIHYALLGLKGGEISTFVNKTSFYPLEEMPTVLRVKGYKFKFYSNENDEPAHIHITKASGNAKYWLEPAVKEEYSYGFTVQERREIRELMQKHYQTLKKLWHENFN